ncbi:transcriptional regulator [Bowmanella denitrificans]|uniref:Transcriptional regulator n=1 Tax=Bowmanella denitrificans TaxID=366582 RepID=A0ABN0XUE4_9ALTE
MQASSDKILYLLKNRGEMTARQLADALQMTAMGARQHLLQLARQNLVSHFSRQGQVGRPKQFWQLTELAQQRFGDMHAHLSLQLLASAKQEFGEQGLEKIIRRREATSRKEYLASMQGLENITDKLMCLSEIRSREGYMASWQEEPGRGYWFMENHCPICTAANQCQQFCRSELELFQACIGEQYHVQRMEHILDGARRCSYLITKKHSK